jgi:uncharacterized protein
MIESSRIIQIVLNYYPNVQALYLFGSYGTEDERQESDVDIALLLSPDESKIAGSPPSIELILDLEHLLSKDIDLINLRKAPTVLQKEVVTANRCIYQDDRYACEEFEMLTLSKYQKLNEERKGIIDSALLTGGRFYEV